MKLSKRGEITIAGACLIVLFVLAFARSVQLISNATKARENQKVVCNTNDVSNVSKIVVYTNSTNVSR